MSHPIPVASRIALPERLFVFELANNHMGDVDHGLRVIDEIAEAAKGFDFTFAFKLQFRDLDSFIHPDFANRLDLKYIKRFSETRLDRHQTRRLIDAIRRHGFLTMCTPFDEVSVDRIVEEGFDILKIASCSLTDWPLLEKIGQTNLPIIGSTAGVDLPDLDNVVSFLRHRDKALALMACVGQYPTPQAELQLNQIDLLRDRYRGLPIGYSTHEDPSEVLPIAMAVAKGATIFEKHVGVATSAYPLNNYSATPDQIRLWLDTARQAFAISGISGRRIEPTNAERDSLFGLRRAVFARRRIKAGERLRHEDVFFAIPTQADSITANDWSKYNLFTATQDLEPNAPVTTANTDRRDVREKVRAIVTRVKHLLDQSHGVVPGEAELEISHHYGLERFDEFGATMVTVVNRNYCKKLIVVLPGQTHPEQFHKEKEETFHVLHGALHLELDGQTRICEPGAIVTITPGVRHAFHSDTGAVFEEISSTHFVNDSFYTDPTIAQNAERKTFLRYWID